MSHKHANLLSTIFHDPISGNIHWREVESLLHHLGAKVEPAHGARFRITLNEVEGFLHHPHHSNVLNRDDVKHLRELLTRAGFLPRILRASRPLTTLATTFAARWVPLPFLTDRKSVV